MTDMSTFLNAQLYPFLLVGVNKRPMRTQKRRQTSTCHQKNACERADKDPSREGDENRQQPCQNNAKKFKSVGAFEEWICSGSQGQSAMLRPIKHMHQTQGTTGHTPWTTGARLVGVRRRGVHGELNQRGCGCVHEVCSV